MTFNQIKNTNEENGIDTINRQLLENQSFLYNENQKLQDDVTRLSRQLENLKSSTVNPELFDALRKEKDNLLASNDILKNKIKNLKSHLSPLNTSELQKENQEKVVLLKTMHELDKLLEKVKHPTKLEVKAPEGNTAKVFEALTKKVEEEHKKFEVASEDLRKLREDDERYILRDKISDMKQLITDLEIENGKLKFENDQLSEDIENYKRQLNEAVEEAKEISKKCYALDDEKDKLKDTISELENEKIKLKKEMIEEMNEANRAKRVSVDTEIALQHISEAYESKRNEVKALTAKLDEAEETIKIFREQFKSL